MQSDSVCLTSEELEHWPRLPKERSIHHRTCAQCAEKVRKLVRPRFIEAAESFGVRRGLSAQEVLDGDRAALTRGEIDEELDDMA
ncbi:MAG: hypothetical protein WDN47_02280 [Candidatus Doudnabacteria bacterium]